MKRTGEPASIRQLLEQAVTRIAGPSARLDAEVLLAFVLNKPRSHLHAWPDRIPDTGQQARFRALIARRTGGEPIAHLTGEREFWSLPVRVTQDTLIPRPETETLVACALEAIPIDSHMQIADLGTGSGAIALAIAHERPDCHIVASDLSETVLQVAADNARRLGLSNIEFAHGCWCDALADRKFDLIVSNPPYIPRSDPHLDRGDVRFEPRSALVSGRDGMDDLSHIAHCAAKHLRPDAWLMLEHGYDQGAPVCRLLSECGYREISGHRDSSGHTRVTTGRYGHLSK